MDIWKRLYWCNIVLKKWLHFFILINNKIKEKYLEFYLYLKYYIDKLINLDRKWNENILSSITFKLVW